MTIITLLTDFGTKDEYVGLMKGVILTINPDVTIIDITHQIRPQNIVQAAFAIKSTYPYFPDGTIHLTVVDPGVGTERAILAVNSNQQYFVAPDNGILTFLFSEENETSVIRVTNSSYFLKSISGTFHGRDIIAPLGAHISKGVPLNALGSETDLAHVIRLRDLHAQISRNGNVTGKVVSIDNFGNLMTNIEATTLAHLCKSRSASEIRFEIGGLAIRGLSATYGNVGPNEPLALLGSRGYLEIAVNGGSAAQYFNIREGDRVQAMLKPGHNGRSK